MFKGIINETFRDNFLKTVGGDTATNLTAITVEPRHDKTNKVIVCPAKTQISLGIHPV